MSSPGTYFEPGAGLPTAPQVRGDLLPDVAVVDLEDRMFKFSTEYGRPMVINVWASYCAPCKQEMPAFGRVGAMFEDRVSVFGLNLAEGPDQVERFTADHGGTYRQLIDPDGTLTSDLGIATLPATLFVDGEGRIVDLHFGALDDDSLKSAIETTLL